MMGTRSRRILEMISKEGDCPTKPNTYNLTSLPEESDGKLIFEILLIAQLTQKNE